MYQDPSIADNHTAPMRRFGVASDVCVHVIPRTGAPPIRITGRRIYHAQGRFAHHISLWLMRSPGYMLSYAAPGPWSAQPEAARVQDLAEAIERIEARCQAYDLDQFKIDQFENCEALWDETVRALQYSSRIQHFQQLAGRAIADWHAAAYADASGA